MTETRLRPVVLCVLDGWGHRIEPDDNAIAQAETPNYDRYLAACPHGLLRTSGADVGLPVGQMGNSDVGHMNLGAGRIVLQDLPRINAALADASLFERPDFADLVNGLRESQGTCHLMGLLSPGGVHAHQAHITTLAHELAARGIPVAVHAFLDGRDTPPASAVGYVTDFLNRTEETGGLRIATVSGRYYAMDRDRRWERTGQAYDAFVRGQGERAPDPLAAIGAAYEAGHTDEFVPPTVIDGYAGMRDGDGLLMANFRADRVRQILSALVEPDFDGFTRSRTVAFTAAAGVASYSSALSAHLATLLPVRTLAATLGDVVAENGLTQLRLAETEKYAHVTFFFNGGREAVLPGEERLLIPSPKVATYDQKPEMSAAEVTDALVEAIASQRFDFILVNFANPDMVGHSGKLDAAIRAVECVDRCLGRIDEAIERAEGAFVVTADHGNAERMRDPLANQPHTAHTTDVVPILLVHPSSSMRTLRDGRLADVAPTVLDLLGLPQPRAMTGESLLAPSAAAGQARERQRLA
jgi:2,3-bisphosphoglycerate-independent phosphoglycerate mutase